MKHQLEVLKTTYVEISPDEMTEEICNEGNEAAQGELEDIDIKRLHTPHTYTEQDNKDYNEILRDIHKRWKLSTREEKEARCPECHTQVSYLHHTEKIMQFQDIRLDGDYIDYSHRETDPLQNSESKYMCPHCHHVIADEESYAKLFLQGKYTPTIITC